MRDERSGPRARLGVGVRARLEVRRKASLGLGLRDER